MKKYFVFIGTFLLSFIGAGVFLIGIMKLIDDANPGFINNPPSMVGMFIIFLAIPSLIAYYVAFEFKKSKKMTGLELDSENDVEVEKPQNHKKESHWLFALLATFAIGGAIIGLLALIPPIKFDPYSFTGIDEKTEFQASESGVQNDGVLNWNTYTDQENNFSFNYPSNWSVDKSYKSVNNSIHFFRMGDKVKYSYQMSQGNEQLIISVSKDQSFEELKKNLNLENPESSVSGKQALRYASGVYILLDPQRNIILSAYRSQYSDDSYLYQILSTFRFTN